MPDVLAILDRQLTDRADRARRYRRKARDYATKTGAPHEVAERGAEYTQLMLDELRNVRNVLALFLALDIDTLHSACRAWEWDGEHRHTDGAGITHLTIGPHFHEARALRARLMGLSNLLDKVGATE